MNYGQLLLNLKKRLKQEYRPSFDDVVFDDIGIRRNKKDEERQLRIAEQKPLFYQEIVAKAEKAIENRFREPFLIQKHVELEVRNMLLCDTELQKYFSSISSVKLVERKFCSTHLQKRKRKTEIVGFA